MTNVKLYHVDDKGLQEGEALGRISVVLKADYEVEVERLEFEAQDLRRRCTHVNSQLTALKLELDDTRDAYLNQSARLLDSETELTKARETVSALIKYSDNLQGDLRNAKAEKCLDGGTCGLGGFCKDCHNLK